MKLSADSLTCVRGGRTVFFGLSFTVTAGEALAVVGRNGAGKSSLLRVIAGLVHLAAGTLTLSGGETEAGVADQAHYLGHQDALKGSLSVLENLVFWIDYLGGSRADASAALEVVDLAPLAGLPAGYLSAGQRRRLSIARLVAVKRPLWLLDEPFAALDAQNRTLLHEQSARHCSAGGIIIAATHDPLGLGNEILRLGNESLKL